MAKVGRPKLYNNCMDLEFFGEMYFESCWQTVSKRNKEGEEWEEEVLTRPYTITGLADALGMERVTLIDYGTQAEFSATVKKLKRRVETFAEEQLFAGKHAAGPIFNLCNNYKRWHQKQEITGADGKDLVPSHITVDSPPKTDTIEEWLRQKAVIDEAMKNVED